MDPLGTWETKESAETRMQRRLQREEQRKRARRRIEVGVVLVGVVFAGSIGIGYATGFARKRVPPAPRVAEGAASAAAVETPPSEAAIATESPVAETTRAAEPEPKVAPEQKPSPKPAPRPKTKAKPSQNPRTKASASPQRLRIGIGATGYDPETLTADASRPIVLTVRRGEGCAAGFNIPKLDVHEDNSKADVTFSLGKVDPGRYTYTCDMGMVSGKLVVR